MAAPRSTSLRALRLLTEQHAPTSTLSSMAPFRRSLHITGAYSAQPASGPDVTSIYRARSINDLRVECERRSLRVNGSKAELVDRLSNHDMLQTRAFSIAMKRIDHSPFASGSRAFNTSRANKAINDSSTMDFAYMPANVEATNAPASGPRVPILPDLYTHYELASTPSKPMKPEIYTVGDLGDNIRGPSPISEVIDNDSIDINPYELAETVGRSRNLASSSERVSEEDYSVKGAVKDIWGGLLDEVLGPKEAGSVAKSR
ncbi:hypothetical protein AJ80_03010 [Polytolypa hystricis UAMH7299]|uniref:SAP domain-containing protein n=1 Tax=Polytolypa hystricis (strain UAMH7299) TaxID=1447883 RepID=A0A2B7YPH5_POLH7|nr:hypothetical protein AJ80_03010 [Polytolypa hystricis UAMH7299]